ncbi:MAG: zinc ABC transporter substrate-binding protein [Ruminococcaceae bacterium]|nr:zinc ABC transporter substrate-binding protein [Oscillospiraceae bacterium]
MRKRITALLLAALCLLGCAGCGVKSRDSDKLTVICTVFPPYDFVRAIAPEAEVSLLLSAGQESHSYEPTPRDIMDIQNCDLFVYVGGESEAWVADMLATMDDPPKTLTLLECVGITPAEEADEHVWTAPPNAIRIVEALEETLCHLTEGDNEALHTAADDYIAALKTLDDQIRAAVQSGARHTLVFADRFPFRHFTDIYGLHAHTAYEGCDHSAEPSAATVAALTDTVKAENVPVVLHIELSNQKLADTVCEATGAQKRLFHSCHNVTKAEIESGVTYLSLMQENLIVLKEALG